MGIFGRKKKQVEYAGTQAVAPKVDLRKFIHKDAAKEIDRALIKGEPVWAVIAGSWDTALVATDRRIFIFKKGMIGGAFGGSRLAVWDNRHIAGIQIETGRSRGMIVVQTVGAPPLDPSIWNDANRKAPNTLALEHKHYDQARRGVDVIRQILAYRS